MCLGVCLFPFTVLSSISLFPPLHILHSFPLELSLVRWGFPNRSSNFLIFPLQLFISPPFVLFSEVSSSSLSMFSISTYYFPTVFLSYFLSFSFFLGIVLFLHTQYLSWSKDNNHFKIFFCPVFCLFPYFCLYVCFSCLGLHPFMLEAFHKGPATPDYLFIFRAEVRLTGSSMAGLVPIMWQGTGWLFHWVSQIIWRSYLKGSLFSLKSFNVLPEG